MNIQLLSLAHHRNGICGNPFWCALFRDEDKTVKLAVLFNEDKTYCSIAVFDVARLALGDIGFGSNSWRGDHYIGDFKKWLANPEIREAAIQRAGTAMAKEAHKLIQKLLANSKP